MGAERTMKAYRRLLAFTKLPATDIIAEGREAWKLSEHKKVPIAAIRATEEQIRAKYKVGLLFAAADAIMRRTGEIRSTDFASFTNVKAAYLLPTIGGTLLGELADILVEDLKVATEEHRPITAFVLARVFGLVGKKSDDEDFLFLIRTHCTGDHSVRLTIATRLRYLAARVRA